MTDADTLAQEVQEQCAVPIEYSMVVDHLTPLVNNFNIERDELIDITCAHFETLYIKEGGVIVEWDGEKGVLDDEVSGWTPSNK